ncbi:MAG: tyrosine-type recombinase/integrase [Armatimonadetes bacterium]|nr:tyrosine-type recombinase/integrase [Armatimonadota bacterium]MCX7968958.1 tyrosine-type recombinase/integrase [Armatimonadota bacterium]MDW8142856.1 tyrosine-type recombinase/integrase [Armatimonadota bacterium]
MVTTSDMTGMVSALGTVAHDFEAAIEVFLLSRQLKKVSPETAYWYRKCLNHFAHFAKARNETPVTFSRDSVLEFIKMRLKSVTPQTVNGDLRAIMAFARFLVAEGIRQDNPTEKVDRIKEPTYYPRTLNDEQIVMLVNTIANHTDVFSGLRDLTLVVLLLDTGLRIREAVNLKLTDIDLSQGFARVIGKGNKERMVPIGESAKKLLMRYIMKRTQISHAGDWLFTSTLGTQLTKDETYSQIRRWAKGASITGVRVSPHSLRFTFVRKWLQSGGDSIVLQRILGHTSPRMTSYCARLFATDLKDVHKRHSPIDSLSPALKIPRKRII